MRKLFTLFTGLLVVSTLWADAVYEPLEVESGFNRDVIAESWPVSNSNAQSYYEAGTSFKYSYATIGTMKESGLLKEAVCDSTGFPEDGRIECISQQTYPGLHWQMAPYGGPNGELSPNALCMRKDKKGGLPNTGRLTFKNVGCYQNLYFLVAAAGSTQDSSVLRQLNVVIYYSDETTDSTLFKFLDHAYVKGENAKYRACHDNFYNFITIKQNDVYIRTDTIWNYPGSYAVAREISVDSHKLIDSVHFENVSSNSDIGIVIFAVTGKTADIAAPDANPAPHSRAPMRTSNITSESFDVEWDEVSGAASYRLDVATDEDFHHMVGKYNNMTVNGTSAHVEGLNDPDDHEYYWRVRSVDASGGQSASSAPRKTVLVGGTAPSTHEEGETIEADLQDLINVAVPSITITRTLYKDGDFNTLCLPFDLSASALATSPIAGCELYEFVGAKVLGSSRLDIEMRRTNNLVAGVPYLLKWANTGEKLTELIFYNVTITKSKGDTIVGVNDEERTALVRFIGNLDQQHLGINNKNYLFLGASNTLYWPNTDNNMYGFRAYFDIPSLLSSPAASPVRQGMPARIVLQEQVATGVENTSAKFDGSEKHLENGELVIIRDGIRYNVMGLQLR